jgi:hypothetical protein
MIRQELRRGSLNSPDVPARLNQLWVKRKVIKEDGKKGYCDDYRQENDPACWKKAEGAPGQAIIRDGEVGRKFVGGAPRQGYMHIPAQAIIGNSGSRGAFRKFV